jgi:predicted site-specific integrase-resolvase
MIEKYYDTKQAAAFYAKNFNIEICERTIQRWCRSGRLQSIKPGKSRYMTKSNLIEALTPVAEKV